MNRFSVVVTTYNRCESLWDTLRALINQQLSDEIGLEIIVVDNNSKDQTRTIVEEIALNSPRPVRYLLETIQGKTHALNKGIHSASGNIIAFCDDDIVADLKWIQTLDEGFSTFNADAAGGPVRPLWLAEPPEWFKIPSRQFGMLAVFDRGNQAIVAGEAERVAGNFLFGSNIAIHRSVFDEIGLFRTDLGPCGKRMAGGEDSEMVRRLLVAGKRVVYLPTAIVNHKIPASRMTLTYLRKWNFWMARSNTRISEFQNVTSGILFLDCIKSACAALFYYVKGLHVKAVGAEINFWWRLGTLTEMLSRKKGYQSCQ